MKKTVLKNLIIILLVTALNNGLLAKELPDFISVKSSKGTALLYKRSLRAPNFKLYKWSSKGYEEIDAPPVRSYRGFLKENPNTLLCAALNPDGGLSITAFDQNVGKSVIWTDNITLGKSLEKYTSDTISNEVQNLKKKLRGPGKSSYRSSSRASRSVPPIPKVFPPQKGMRVSQMGFDLTAASFSKSYSGNIEKAVAGIEQLMNVHDHFMARDAQICHFIPTIVIRTQEKYKPKNAGDQIGQVKKEWSKSPLSKFDWDQVHSFKTSKGLFGAAGWGTQGAIGKGTSAISIECLYHEAGHNWNASHSVYTHDIMGGNRPVLGPLTIDRVLEKREKSMQTLKSYPENFPDPLHPYTHFDMVATEVNRPISIPVLYNDWDANGGVLKIHSFTKKTKTGGTVTQSGNNLYYTPAKGYSGRDIIVYSVINSGGLKSKNLVIIEVFARDIMLHYSFDNNQGAQIQDSINGHHGTTPSGSPQSANGVVGKAIAVPKGGIICDSNTTLTEPLGPNSHFWPFDAGGAPTYNSMTFHNSFDPLNHDFSISFWCNFRNLGQGQVLLTKEVYSGRGYKLQAQKGGFKLSLKEFLPYGPSKKANMSISIKPQTWYHVAMVINRRDNKAYLYVNGKKAKEKISIESKSFIAMTRKPLRIAPESNGNVLIDEFKIYGKALDERSIKNEIKQAGK